MKYFIVFFILISNFVFAQKSHLKKQINGITNGKSATVGISVKGIDFPFELHNENAQIKLPTLSVYKFHIALAALNFVDEGKLRLNQKFLIKKEELLPDTHSPFRDKFPEGNVEATLDELIYYSVSLSDNNTTDILLRKLGGTETVQNFMDSKKVRDFQIKFNEEMMHKGAQYIYPNQTSPKSLSRLYKKFYQGKILSKKSTAYLYDILSRTSTGANKLKEQLAENSVAHKTGSSGTDKNGFTIAENDSGIVTLKNGKHYAITVFVTDSREKPEVNARMISDISKAVFDYLNK